MDVDARFANDYHIDNRMNVAQVICHVALADAGHYVWLALKTKRYARLSMDKCHEAAHQAFEAFEDEFDVLLRPFLAQVYCRTFLHMCGYLVTRKVKEKTDTEDKIVEMVREGKLDLHFIGLEDTPSGGNATAVFFEHSFKEEKHNGNR